MKKNYRVLSGWNFNKIIKCVMVVCVAILLLIAGITIFDNLRTKETKSPIDPLAWSVDTWSVDRMSDTAYINNFGNRGEDTYTIDSADSFRYFVYLVNTGEFKGSKVYLNKSIDFNGNTIPSIGTNINPFSATFNGGYYTLMNVRVSGNGLFGITQNATIKNIGVYNLTLDNNTNNTGGLIGRAINTNINNSFVKNVEINETKTFGGLVGEYVSDVGSYEITKSFADCSITGQGVGGLIGTAKILDTDKLTIKNSYYTFGDNPINNVDNANSIKILDTIKANGLGNFNNREVWRYEHEYNEKNSWCDYVNLENSRELNFDYPILTEFEKVYLTGCYYVVTVEINDEVINVSTLQQAIDMVEQNSSVDIYILVEQISITDYVLIKGNKTINLLPAKNVLIKRAKDNNTSLIIIDGSSVSIGDDNYRIVFDGNCEFVLKNNKQTGSIISTFNGAELFVQGVDFNNNISNKNSDDEDYFNNSYIEKVGGAITSCGYLSLGDNTKFNNCRADNGGAIYSDNAMISIYGANFNDCKATFNGGAIYISGRLDIYKDAVFNNNSAQYGGAIYLADIAGIENHSIINITGSPEFSNVEVNNQLDSIAVASADGVDLSNKPNLYFKTNSLLESANNIKFYMYDEANITAVDKLENITFYHDSNTEYIVDEYRYNDREYMSFYSMYLSELTYKNLVVKYEYFNNKYIDYKLVSGANLGITHSKDKMYLVSTVYSVEDQSGNLYEDLYTALNTDNTEFYVLEDITITESISMFNGEEILLRAKNKNVNIQIDIDDNPAFNISNGSKLIIGAVEDQYYINMMTTGKDNREIINLDYHNEMFNGELTTFTLNNGNIFSSNTCIVAGNCSKIEIRGGTIVSNSGKSCIMMKNNSSITSEFQMSNGKLYGGIDTQSSSFGLNINGNVSLQISGGTIKGKDHDDIYLGANFKGEIEISNIHQEDLFLTLGDSIIPEYLDTTKQLLKVQNSAIKNTNGYIITDEGYLISGTCEIEFSTNNTEYGTVSIDKIIVPIDCFVYSRANELVFSNGEIVAATAFVGYEFTEWSIEDGLIDSDRLIMANFAPIPQYTISIMSNNDNFGTITTNELTVTKGTAYSTNKNIIKFNNNTITAKANKGYIFTSWSVSEGIVSGDLNVLANFVPAGARIEEEYYLSIYDAVKNTISGSTVYLLDDVVVDKTIYISNNITLTSDNKNVTLRRANSFSEYMIYSTAEKLTLGVEDGDYSITFDGNKFTNHTKSILYIANNFEMKGNIKLINNFAESGGAIYLDGEVDNVVDISGGAISNCNAVYGGAIYTYYPTINITKCKFENNSAEFGQDIYIRDKSKVNLGNITIGEIATHVGATDVVITINETKINKILINNNDDIVRLVKGTNCATKIQLSENVVSNKLNTDKSIIVVDSIDNVANEFLINEYSLMIGEELNDYLNSKAYDNNDYYLVSNVEICFTTNNDYGKVGKNSISVPFGTHYIVDKNIITFSSNDTIKATVNTNSLYRFSRWLLNGEELSSLGELTNDKINIIAEFITDETKSLLLSCNLEASEGSVSLDDNLDNKIIIDNGEGLYSVDSSDNLVILINNIAENKSVVGFKYKLDESSNYLYEDVNNSNNFVTMNNGYKIVVSGISEIQVLFYERVEVNFNVDELEIMADGLVLDESERIIFTSLEGFVVEVGRDTTSFSLYSSVWSVMIPESISGINLDCFNVGFPDLIQNYDVAEDGMNGFIVTIV